MKIAVAALGNFHAKPFGTAMQLKQMLDGLRFAEHTNAHKSMYNIEIIRIFHLT
jgi:hypothetical protein